MATTIYKLSEQVLRLVKGGDQKMASSLDIAEVKELVAQLANAKLKATHFSETMAGGERIPNGLMLATYTGVPVVAYAGRSKAILPAAPMQLPKGLGIFQVVPELGDPKVPDLSCEYIPVPAGQFWMIQKEGLISDLMGMVGYENYGTELLFTKDLTKLSAPVTSVMVRLAIMDIAKLSDFDLLPVPADMEAMIIQEAYNILTGQKPRINVVDPVAEAQ